MLQGKNVYPLINQHFIRIDVTRDRTKRNWDRPSDQGNPAIPPCQSVFYPDMSDRGKGKKLGFLVKGKTG